MLPLLGFCRGSCFYGDTFYKVAAHEGLTVHWPKKTYAVLFLRLFDTITHSWQHFLRKGSRYHYNLFTSKVQNVYSTTSSRNISIDLIWRPH